MEHVFGAPRGKFKILLFCFVEQVVKNVDISPYSHLLLEGVVCKHF
jgi:hypothetical protein